MNWEDRFWAKVNKNGPNGCWVWTASKTQGYGAAWDGTAVRRAHRLAYKLLVGDPGNLFLCHKCDNPSCVNPDHLFPGTQKDNMADCSRKKRYNPNRGVENVHSTLSNQDVIEIRDLYPRYSSRKLGNLYRVSHTTILFLVKNWTYK